jgi:ketosteroid isomerase-like protein
MMNKSIQLAFACLSLLMAGTSAAGEAMLEQLRQQVEDTERAFAQTMAERDHDAFMAFLSEETVFFSGDTPLRGRQRVAETWKPYFDGPDAPFSWEPELVVVLDSGTLALSSGPVRNPSGQRVATFNSIWRLEPSGQWRIVFDKGSTDCPATAEEG